MIIVIFKNIAKKYFFIRERVFTFLNLFKNPVTVYDTASNPVMIFSSAD